MMSLIKPYGKFGFTRPLYGSPPYGMSAGGGFPLTHAKDDLVTHWRTWGDPITDYVTKDGDKRVSVILDQSGEDNDWIQAVGNNQPLWSEDAGDLIGGHEVIKFTTDEFVTCHALADLLEGTDEPFSIFIVMQRTRSGSDHKGVPFSLGFSADNDPYFVIDFIRGPERWWLRRSDNVPVAKLAYSIMSDPEEPLYTSIIFDGQDISMWRDGALKIDAVNLDVGACTFDRCAIGTLLKIEPSYFFEGNIVEFALCTKDLSDARRLAVEAYFASEYGM